MAEGTHHACLISDSPSRKIRSRTSERVFKIRPFFIFTGSDSLRLQPLAMSLNMSYII